LGDVPVLFSHPVYEYLILRYDLNARSLHWEPDEAPTPKQWRQLQTLLREHPARILFWESEPLSETARRAADLGVTSIVFAPCGNRCGDDWLAAMRGNAKRLESAVRRSP
jgi:zinc transport system substrate-binding protein